MKKALTTKHSIDTIDDRLRENGYTISRDHYSRTSYTLRKETATEWIFDREFTSKKELVEFANNL